MVFSCSYRCTRFRCLFRCLAFPLPDHHAKTSTNGTHAWVLACMGGAMHVHWHMHGFCRLLGFCLSRGNHSDTINAWNTRMGVGMHHCWLATALGMHRYWRAPLWGIHGCWLAPMLAYIDVARWVFSCLQLRRDDRHCAQTATRTRVGVVVGRAQNKAVGKRIRAAKGKGTRGRTKCRRLRARRRPARVACEFFFTSAHMHAAWTAQQQALGHILSKP